MRFNRRFAGVTTKPMFIRQSPRTASRPSSVNRGIDTEYFDASKRYCLRGAQDRGLKGVGLRPFGGFAFRIGQSIRACCGPFVARGMGSVNAFFPTRARRVTLRFGRARSNIRLLEFTVRLLARLDETYPENRDGRRRCDQHFNDSSGTEVGRRVGPEVTLAPRSARQDDTFCKPTIQTGR